MLNDRAEVHPDFVKYLDGRWMGREDASRIIEYVGANSPAGNYPGEIPPYLLGRAIGRLVYNYFTKEVVTKTNAVLEQDANTITREFLTGLFQLSL